MTEVTPMVRILFTLAALSAGAAGIQAQEQSAASRAAVCNQQLADDVAGYVRKSGVASGARISISTQDGVVELSGDVRSLKQGDQIVEQVMLVPGVSKVETALKVMIADELQPVNNAEPSMALMMQPPAAPVQAQNLAMGGHHGMTQPLPVDPVPLGAPSQPAYDMTGPKLPPYAWPTYAPYPNYSRVAYPQAYPYNAFPFIGPFYPFPKVPLGWRSVKLEWDDGHWYLGRLSTPHDYWRVKFW